MDARTLTDAISTRLGCDDSTTRKLLESFATIVCEECGRENKVAIPGFGGFEGVKHNEEVVENLSTGKRMLLPPMIEVKFTPGVILKKKLKGGAK